MLKAILCVALQLLPPAAKLASDTSHDRQNGAQMSQKLPSFHDWGDPSHAPSTAAPPAVYAATAAAQEAAALSHQAPSLPSPPTSARPNIPAQPSSILRPPQPPSQLSSGEVWSEEAEWQLGGDADGQQPHVLAAPGVLDTNTSVGVAEALFDTHTGSNEQGTLKFAASCVKVSVGSTCQGWMTAKPKIGLLCRILGLLLLRMPLSCVL